MKYRMIQTVALITLLFFVGKSWDAGAQQKAFPSMFADRRAHQIGDIVTILLVEYTSASSEASTSTGKSSENGMNLTGGQGRSAYLPMYGLNGKIQNKYRGNASTSRQGSLRGKITATITKVTESGNLEIEGTRDINVNGEKQQTIISGIIRPQDITVQNTIYSYNIANAKISYKGKGIVDKGQRPGLLARLFNWIF